MVTIYSPLRDPQRNGKKTQRPLCTDFDRRQSGKWTPNRMVSGMSAHTEEHHVPNSRQPEFAHAHEVLAYKVKITVASPKGGKAPLDPQSIDMYGEDPYCKKFLKEHQSLWYETEKLSDVLKRIDEFEGVYYVGGHGRKSHH
jgi:hypothetical protein